MISGRPWHNQRLLFLISSARHFVHELAGDGWNVTYLKAESTTQGLQDFQAKHDGAEIVCARPNSFRLQAALAGIGVTFIDNDFFLTSRDVFQSWAGKQKTYTMENFYREQRRRLDLLVDGSEPLGGQWNFDAENRQPPPKDHDWGLPLQFEFDDIDREVLAELSESAWGRLPDEAESKIWGTSRREALAQMNHFFEHHFGDFGPFEDAMPSTSWSGHHSLLSPYLNNGLLHASEVVAGAIARFEKGDISIASCEGFIRQVIGWREYINGMYWFLGEEYRTSNGLQANRDLFPLFHDASKTKMNCVGSVMRDVQDYGWTHHIPRLMVLSNLALIAGISPQQFLNWMREVFVDAADWVMVPNVIGMATHADGGTLMTKPYAAGGAYISKMGQFCKECPYDPKQRVGQDACPFTTLYWDFMDRHQERFSKNHRMFQQLAGLRKLSNIEEVRVRADEVLAGLETGTI